MKNTIIGLVVLIILALIVMPASTQASDMVPVIIGFEDKPDKALVSAHGGAIKYEYNIIPAISARLPAAAIENMKNAKGISFVEEDTVVYAIGKPANKGKPDKYVEPPTQPDQVIGWNMYRIQVSDAWTASTGSGVKVAVIDTGIDKDHPDITVAGGVSFADKNPFVIRQTTKWDDDNGHGTHVAGTIAALNNDIGVVGAAPDVSLYAVKVLGKGGSGYVSDIIAGIDWAVSNNMDIATMSLGGPGYSQAFQNAITSAHGSGVLIIAAAGNGGDGNILTVEISYPAAYDNVVAVAATDVYNNLARFSNSGPYVDIAAPGVGIRSTWNDGLYNSISGTSMACPHITGVAALVLAKNSSLTPDDVSHILTNSAIDLGNTGFDWGYGHGLVNASAAVMAAN